MRQGDPAGGDREAAGGKDRLQAPRGRETLQEVTGMSLGERTGCRAPRGRETLQEVMGTPLVQVLFTD